MLPQERHKIKDLLRKARIASGKKYLNKAARKAVIDGYLALKKLGIYNQPAEVDRKEKPRKPDGS